LRWEDINWQKQLITVRHEVGGDLQRLRGYEASKPRGFAPNPSGRALSTLLDHRNHDPSPSDADFRLTRRLGEGARILQINMLDHVIVGQLVGGGPGFFSFMEAGVL
jgi:DNA repair protein RadC